MEKSWVNCQRAVQQKTGSQALPHSTSRAPSRSPSALGFGRRRRRRPSLPPVPSPTPPPPRGRDPSLPASCWPGRSPPPPPPRRPAAAALGPSSNPAPPPSPRAAGPVRLPPPPGLTPPSPCVRPVVQSGGRRPTPQSGEGLVPPSTPPSGTSSGKELISTATLKRTGP